MGKGSFRERLGPDGTQTREVLFNTKDSEIIIRPEGCELHREVVDLWEYE